MAFPTWLSNLIQVAILVLVVLMFFGVSGCVARNSAEVQAHDAKACRDAGLTHHMDKLGIVHCGPAPGAKP